MGRMDRIDPRSILEHIEDEENTTALSRARGGMNVLAWLWWSCSLPAPRQSPCHPLDRGYFRKGRKKKKKRGKGRDRGDSNIKSSILLFFPCPPSRIGAPPLGRAARLLFLGLRNKA